MELRKGMKVHSLVNQFDVKEGKVYDVDSGLYGGAGVRIIDDVGDSYYMAVGEFEFVPVAEATGTVEFKVGDRVRISKEPTNGGFGEKGDTGTIDFVGDGYVRMKFDSGKRVGGSWWISKDEIEHAAVAAQPQLTIQAGRYYKTRDGRKVGPMRDDDAPGYMSTDVDGVCRSFEVDGGKHWDPEFFLIAEWPSDAPASIVDANLGNITAGALTNPAIVCPLENGHPKPAVRPFVHANADAASDEAARLAKKHPGKAFAVYEYKRTAKVEPQHEWQRLAAQGNMAAATDALVKASGISRDDARRIVYTLAA